MACQNYQHFRKLSLAAAWESEEDHCDEKENDSEYDQYVEDDDEVDYDDGGEDKFYVSTLEEDQIVSSFVDWLQTIDVTRKSLRTALSHGNVIQNMLQFDPDIKVSYLNLFCWKCLNKWVVDSTKLQKKPGTIKTCLGSVKQYYRFTLMNSDSGALPPWQNSNIGNNDQAVK